MIWFILIIGVLIFCPAILAIIGISIIALAVPFIVFAVVWGFSILIASSISPDLLPIGIIGGFIGGIIVARKLVIKVSSQD